MKRIGIVPVVLALACGGDSSGPEAQIDGRWQATLLTSVTGTPGYSCAGTVQLDLEARSGALTGTYARMGTCTTPHDRRDDHTSGSITAGTVTGSTVRFRTAACMFEGALEGGRLAGRVDCDRPAGIDLSFTGTWAAMRP